MVSWSSCCMLTLLKETENGNRDSTSWTMQDSWKGLVEMEMNCCNVVSRFSRFIIFDPVSKGSGKGTRRSWATQNASYSLSCFCFVLSTLLKTQCSVSQRCYYFHPEIKQKYVILFHTSTMQWRRIFSKLLFAMLPCLPPGRECLCTLFELFTSKLTCAINQVLTLTSSAFVHMNFPSFMPFNSVARKWKYPGHCLWGRLHSKVAC